jgi:hypothetical protein
MTDPSGDTLLHAGRTVRICASGGRTTRHDAQEQSASREAAAEALAAAKAGGRAVFYRPRDERPLTSPAAPVDMLRAGFSARCAAGSRSATSATASDRGLAGDTPTAPLAGNGPRHTAALCADSPNA